MFAMRLRSALAVLVWLIPLCLFAAVILGVQFGLSEIHTLSAAGQKAAATPSQASALTVEELKTRLDDLKWLLTLLITAAGLFVVIQSVAAFFNAQNFNRQSEDAVKRLNTAADEAQARFPLFTAIDQARRRAEQIVLGKLGYEGFDWRNDAYEELGLDDRQSLLSVEGFISSEFLPSPAGDEGYARRLRVLASFYASKFRYEASRNAPHLADLERAEYYLALACNKIGDAFYLLNDLGVLYLVFYHPPDLDKAQALFEKSLSNTSAQQRAHYNLAVIAGKRERYDQAIKHSEDALKVRPAIWETRDVPEQRCNLLYNLACYRAQYMRQPAANASEQVSKLLKDLAQAASIGQIRQKTVTYDWEDPEGDMHRLVTRGDAHTVAKLNELRPQLSANRGAPPPVSLPWRERIASAMKILTGKAY